MRRELTEELGCIPDIQELKPLDVYVSNRGDFVYYSFVIVTDGFDNFEVSEPETNDYVWLPVEHLLSILTQQLGK